VIKKLSNQFQSKEKKRLLSNFLSLTFLQGANYILPLLTLPYLVRVLGVEYFGLLAFATVFIMYFQIITDYGFNLTATREISIHRNNHLKIVEIFSAVMSIKIILMVISFLLMILIVFNVEKFSKDWEIYFLTFGMVIGQTFFPIWFFQGMEKMKYITYLNILAKSIFTIAIFIFVQKKSDYYIVPILNSIGFIIAGFWSLYLVNKKFNISFKIQNFETIKYYLLDGWHVFISNLAISIYTVSTTFILGLFTNNVIVGYFAAADKIIQAFKGLLTPVSQAIYPYISRKVSHSKEEGLQTIRKVSKYIAYFTFAVGIVLLISAPFIVHLLLGGQYKRSVILLQIMAFLPFMIGLSNVFGIQTMLPFNRKKAFSYILITGSLISIVLSFLLVPLLEDIGSAITVTITESFITLAMFAYLQRNGLKII